MEDAINKAIPLKRARAVSSRLVAERPSRWLEPLRGGVQAALAAPRQAWLAALGAGALATRGAWNAWDRLVAEGQAVEGRFRARPAGPREIPGPS